MLCWPFGQVWRNANLRSILFCNNQVESWIPVCGLLNACRQRRREGREKRNTGEGWIRSRKRRRCWQKNTKRGVNSEESVACGRQREKRFKIDQLKLFYMFNRLLSNNLALRFLVKEIRDFGFFDGQLAYFNVKIAGKDWIGDLILKSWRKR